MKLFSTLAGTALLCMVSTMAAAEVAVIVNPANTDTLNKDEITRLYMAKAKAFPNGTNAIPIDRPEGSMVRQEFISNVMEKEETQLKAYWSRLIFTGRGVPPRSVNSDEDAKEIVKNNKDAIGYINTSAVDNSVRVVGIFK